MKMNREIEKMEGLQNNIHDNPELLEVHNV